MGWTAPNRQRKTLARGIAEVAPSVTKLAQVRFQYGLACCLHRHLIARAWCGSSTCLLVRCVPSVLLFICNIWKGGMLKYWAHIMKVLFNPPVRWAKSEAACQKERAGLGIDDGGEKRQVVTRDIVDRISTYFRCDGQPNGETRMNKYGIYGARELGPELANK